MTLRTWARRRLPAAVAVLGAVGLCSACTDWGNTGGARKVSAPRSPYVRIVSMAPSVTETLFALGLGPAIVGVTRFCNYPPETNAKVRVGGYFDTNYEVIMGLAPDLIVLLEEHETAQAYFRARGENVVAVNHTSIEGILDSIRQLGMVTGTEAAAEALTQDLTRRLAAVVSRTRGRRRPRTLITVGRTPGAAQLESVCIAGADQFYDRMLALAGGQNVFSGHLPYPVVSTEGLLAMNPEAIIEIVTITGSGNDATTIAALRRDWERLPHVTAVREHRIAVLVADYAVIPGPRFVLLLEELMCILHPEQ